MAPGSEQMGVCACGQTKVGPPTAAAERGRLQAKEERPFQQKQGGHPGSLALDYAIICWFGVMWRILLIFSDMLGKRKWHLCLFSPRLEVFYVPW